MYFLRPDTLAKFLEKARTAWRTWRETEGTARPRWPPPGFGNEEIVNPQELTGWIFSAADWITGFRPVRLSVSAASGIKHPASSWAGVITRSMLGGFIVGLNIWLWYSAFLYHPGEAKCGRVSFLFGRHEATNGLILFFKIAATALAIPCGIMLFFSRTLLYWLFVFTQQSLEEHAAHVLAKTRRRRTGSIDTGLGSSPHYTTHQTDLPNQVVSPRRPFKISNAFDPQKNLLDFLAVINMSSAASNPLMSGVVVSPLVQSSERILRRANEIGPDEKPPPLSELGEAWLTLLDRGVEMEKLLGEQESEQQLS